MEQEYNWNAILWGAMPVSVLIALVFYMNINNWLKWLFLVIGMIAAAVITYYIDRKKHNISTSPFIVLIVGLIIYGLKNFGFI